MPASWPDEEIIEKSDVYVDLGEYKAKYNDILTQILVD